MSVIFGVSHDDLVALAPMLPASAVYDPEAHQLQVDDGDGATVQNLVDNIAEHRTGALKKRLLSYAADKRWHVETSGFLWRRPNSDEVYFISTDDRSQSKIDAERKAADEGRRRPGDVWKCGDPATGSVVYPALTDADIIDMSNHVRDGICDCFNTEAAIHAQIAAGVITTEAAIDAASWPSPGLR